MLSVVANTFLSAKIVCYYINIFCFKKNITHFDSCQKKLNTEDKDLVNNQLDYTQYAFYWEPLQTWIIETIKNKHFRKFIKKLADLFCKSIIIS